MSECVPVCVLSCRRFVCWLCVYLYDDRVVVGGEFVYDCGGVGVWDVAEYGYV